MHVTWRKGKDAVMQAALQILAENDVEASLLKSSLHVVCNQPWSCMQSPEDMALLEFDDISCKENVSGGTKVTLSYFSFHHPHLAMSL